MPMINSVNIHVTDGQQQTFSILPSIIFWHIIEHVYMHRSYTWKITEKAYMPTVAQQLYLGDRYFAPFL